MGPKQGGFRLRPHPVARLGDFRSRERFANLGECRSSRSDGDGAEKIDVVFEIEGLSSDRDEHPMQFLVVQFRHRHAQGDAEGRHRAEICRVADGLLLSELDEMAHEQGSEVAGVQLGR